MKVRAKQGWILSAGAALMAATAGVLPHAAGLEAAEELVTLPLRELAPLLAEVPTRLKPLKETAEPLLEPLRTLQAELTPLQRLNQLTEEWRERKEFMDRSLAFDAPPPVHTIGDPEDLLGPLPRPTDHPYFTPEFQREVDLSADSQLTAGNTMELLVNADSWDRKSALMDEATERLYVTAMIMRCDEGGQAFTRHMADAARRGVDTRFILDGLFSFYAVPCLQDMTDAGVKVSLSMRSVQPRTLDWEMHEKLMIVDGVVATIGGQNVGTWYQETNGTDGWYRDTDVLLRGPIVGQLARRFVRLWESLEPEDHSLEPFLAELDAQDAAWEQLGQMGAANYGRWLAPDQRRGLCRFVAQDPHLDTFHVWSAYQLHLEYARERVMLTAYALEPLGSPIQESFRDRLAHLAASGARVDIITNGSGVLDSDVVPSLFRRSYAKSILSQAWDGLGHTPVQLWTYNYFMHAKQYWFDGAAASIGSFNYDASGLRCQESVVICYDPDLVDDVATSFALDIANSHLVSEIPPVMPPQSPSAPSPAPLDGLVRRHKSSPHSP